MSDNVKELFLKALEEKYAKKSAKTDDGDGMDAPGEEDADVDNDGDSDSSDKYLLKRRKAIAKAMKKEEAEDLDENVTDNYKDAHGKAEKHHRSMAHKHWKAMDAAKENGDHEAAEAHGDQGYEHSFFADRHKHEARHGASRGQARTFKRLAREGGMVTKKSKAMGMKEEFELDEDITHQTVKPPSHTKKFSHRDNRDIDSIEAPGNKRHTVTSSQADAHDKTAAHHNEVADAHTKAKEKSSSPTLQRLHHQASVHHKKAAEAHFNASHSSSGEDKDGSIEKKAKDLHMAYHLTMHANKMSQEVRNKGSKAKRMNEESVDEGILGAIGGGAIGAALGNKYATKLAGAGALGGAKLAAKLGMNMVKGAKYGAAAAKAAPTVAGAVIGDRLTGRRKKKVNEEEMYEEEVYLVAAEFLLDEGIDYNDLTEDELNEFLGRMAKAMGRGIKRQTIDRVTTSGRADRAQRAADKMQKKNDTVARLQQQKKRVQQQKDRAKRLKQGRATPMDRSQQGAQPA